MNICRRARYLLCLVLLFGMLSGLLGSSVVLAAQEGDNSSFSPPPSQEEEPPPEEQPELRLASKYPSLIGLPGFIFSFPIEMEYRHFEEEAEFDLNVTPPSPYWAAFVIGGTPPGEQKEIATITLGSGSALERITVLLGPLPGYTPEPGEYVTTLEASSDTVENSIDLTAVVTTNYKLSLDTATGQLKTEVKAGTDNHISILLTNTGSATIENITFSSDKPDGWSVTFNPDEIDSLEPRLSGEVDMVITPAKETIAGDYAITLKAESEHISDSLKLTVTMPTRPIWEGAGIGIGAAVVASLVVFFGRFSRRW